jgi:hypothetical protein
MTPKSQNFIDYLGGLETKTVPPSKKKINDAYAAVMKKSGLKRKTSGAKKTGRVLLLAAAVAVCAAATAAAAGLNVGELLRGYFEQGGVKQSYGASAAPAAMTQSQVEVLNKSGTAVGQSVSNNGTTIAVKALVGDENNAYILFGITAPEGTKLNRNDYSFERDDSTEGIAILEKDGSLPHSYGGWSGGWDYATIKDADPGDNKIQIVLNISYAGLDLRGKEVRLALKDITVPDKNRKTQYLPVVKGEWKFTIPLDYTSTSKKLTVNKPARFNMAEAVNPNESAEEREKAANEFHQCTVSSIRLSSLSVLADFSGKSSGEKGDGFTIPFSLTLKLKDGSQVSVQNNGPGSGSATTMATSYRFDAPIDPDNVSSIVIGDLTIPVS